MQLFKYIERINLMDRLIRQERTGTQVEFASCLMHSVSQLARIIEYLKEIGAPLEYDRSRNTLLRRRIFDSN